LPSVTATACMAASAIWWAFCCMHGGNSVASSRLPLLRTPVSWLRAALLAASVATIWNLQLWQQLLLKQACSDKSLLSSCACKPKQQKK